MRNYVGVARSLSQGLSALLAAAALGGCLNDSVMLSAPEPDSPELIQIAPYGSYGGPTAIYSAGMCGSPSFGFQPGGPISGASCTWHDPSFDPAVVDHVMTTTVNVGKWVPFCTSFSEPRKTVDAFRMTVAQYQALGAPIMQGTYTIQTQQRTGRQQIYYWMNPAINGSQPGVTGVPVRLLAFDSQFGIQFPILNPGVPIEFLVYGNATGQSNTLFGYIQFRKTCMDAAIAASGLGPNDTLFEISVQRG